jgi:hypothetical protein
MSVRVGGISFRNKLSPGLLNPLNEQIGLLGGDDDYVVFVIAKAFLADHDLILIRADCELLSPFLHRHHASLFPSLQTQRLSEHRESTPAGQSTHQWFTQVVHSPLECLEQSKVEAPRGDNEGDNASSEVGQES